jgi:hypothetical protein
MPLTEKGSEILSNMEKTYGSEEKAKSVFYASRNAGTISGVDSARPDTNDALSKCAAALDSVSKRIDSLLIRQRTGHEKSRHDGRNDAVNSELKELPKRARRRATAGEEMSRQLSLFDA